MGKKIEGFIKVNCKRYRGPWFYLRIVKILPSVPFSKVRMEPRNEFLTKAKALVEIFEVVFLDILSYKVRSSVMFARNFSNPFDIR